MIGLVFLENIYKERLQWVVDVEGDDMQVGYHLTCTLRCYLLLLGDTSIFVDKRDIYVDVVYLQYIINFPAIHEYNWGPVCLAYLY